MQFWEVIDMTSIRKDMKEETTKMFSCAVDVDVQKFPVIDNNTDQHMVR